ncbi:capsular exopolysaccharide family [Melioribacter roseus P3M-2]|uniref:non-specific protein-tyrosine kinase n=1 Tax=Melioribacter roseus (strain DSM 23840 / JCM 17771 / VKM B-2668 / P3M-2) TaxID=1191523 RepID=I6ZVA1_MELRP|nr:polysaccharide biosynthesis tyrosine autokinase [Melioribacter roseus]AFN75929.1 capsular exopolysaccharide family [Melioribacter roseus P3M-2]
MNNNDNNFYQENNSLKDYINLIRLNIGSIVVISLTALIVAVVYALNAPDIYKSTTTLKITKPQGSILDAPLIPEFQDFGSDRFIANEIEILKSYSLRNQVAETLSDTFKLSRDKDKFELIVDREDRNTKPTLMPIEDIVELLESEVDISQKRGLDIVEITVESRSPYEASLIANCYAEAYKKLNLTYNRQQLTAIKEFLAQQREEKLAELSAVEEALRTYQEQKGIVELPEQARALIEQTTDFESKMNATKIDLTIAENNLKQYKAELAKQDPNINDYIESFATEPYIKNLQLQIADLQTQKDRALSSYKDSPRRSEIIREFDAKINDLKEKLNNQLTVYRAGILASSPEEIKELTRKVLEEEVKYQSLKASYEKLSEIVADYDKRLNKLPTSSIDLARLTREKQAYEKLYLQVEEKYQEAIINEQSVPGNVMIIDPAIVPTIPSKPNRLLIVFAGLVIGVGLGLGFAFLRHNFDNTIKTPEDIQNRNINILAWIPHIEGIETNPELEFIVSKKPDASASEAYRALRTRIKFSKIDKDSLRTILVTSPRSQEGKTTTAVNLAGSLAYANNKTIIIDADLRKPRLHNVFGHKRYPGFTDYFFGQVGYEEIIRTTDVNNLSYISAGTIPPNPSEILGSDQMINFIKKLKGEYDYVVIDSPPLIAVTDSEILAQLVDATILVVSANFTETDLLEKSVEILRRDNSTFIGTVLNNFNYRSGYSSYYKYYYYYSSPTNGSKKNRVKAN